VAVHPARQKLGEALEAIVMEKTTLNAKPADEVGHHYVSTTNACKLCTPLGAAMAFQGIEGAIPFLHGSQGCATYMRRYVISHYREPIDIASSSLGEKHAVYGGGPNLKQGIRNVMKKYRPKVIGIATTCLTETIGDDVPMILQELRRELENLPEGSALPLLVPVSTPSYSGTQADGFLAALRSVVATLADDAKPHGGINLLPGLVSPADIRYLKEILRDFNIGSTILPDISDRLDAPAVDHYEKLPPGGTPVASIRAMGGAMATIEFGRTLPDTTPGNVGRLEAATAGLLLAERYDQPRFPLGLPIGLRESDAFFHVLEEVSGRETPEDHLKERGRLVDAYVDGHKYVFGKRAIVYGEEDLVVGLVAFLAEIGIKPVLCASGGKSGRFEKAVAAVTDGILDEPPRVMEGVDFHQIGELSESLGPDLMIGHSKGYSLARGMKIPLIRVGFPIHDRFGGQRLRHIGYRGTQDLLDRVVNAILKSSQESSPVGYGYL
jgi:nitrogenase molybdenum-iron protein NifN